MTGERDRMTNELKRFLAYATVLTLAVGVLGGILARMTVLIPIDWSDSTVEARVATVLVVGIVVLVALLYVALPIVVALFRADEDGRWARHGAVAIGAVVGPPLALWGTFYGVLDRLPPAEQPTGLLGILFLAVVVAVVLVTMSRLDRLPTVVDWKRPAWPIALNLVLVLLFAVGFVGSQPFAVAFAADHTAEYGGYAGPRAEFQVDTEPTGNDTMLLTLTHDGGDPLHSDRLYLSGEGFADVAGADQTSPGVWQGTVSGERPRRGGPAVVRGDSVTVGVTRDCTVVLRYNGTERSTFVAGHDCNAP